MESIAPVLCLANEAIRLLRKIVNDDIVVIANLQQRKACCIRIPTTIFLVLLTRLAVGIVAVANQEGNRKNTHRSFGDAPATRTDIFVDICFVDIIGFSLWLSTAALCTSSYFGQPSYDALQYGEQMQDACVLA